MSPETKAQLPKTDPPPEDKPADAVPDKVADNGSATKKDDPKKQQVKKVATGNDTKTVAKKPIPGADSNDPKVLLNAGRAADKAKDLEQARAIYNRYTSTPGANAMQGTWEEARIAYLQNDNKSVEMLLMRVIAVKDGNPLRIDAQLLLADVHFRTNDFPRARNLYIGVRKALKDSDPRKASITKRIAACNKQMGMAENDGLTR